MEIKHEKKNISFNDNTSEKPEVIVQDLLLKHTSLIIPLCKIVWDYYISRRITWVQYELNEFKLYQLDIDECRAKGVVDEKLFKPLPLPSFVDGKSSGNYTNCIIWSSRNDETWAYNFNKMIRYRLPDLSNERVEERSFGFSSKNYILNHLFLQGRHYILCTTLPSQEKNKIMRNDDGSPYLFLETEDGKIRECKTFGWNLIDYNYSDESSFKPVVCGDILCLFVAKNDMLYTFILDVSDRKSILTWISLTPCEIYSLRHFKITADDTSGKIYFISRYHDTIDKCKYFDVKMRKWILIDPYPVDNVFVQPYYVVTYGASIISFSGYYRYIIGINEVIRIDAYCYQDSWSEFFRIEMNEKDCAFPQPICCI